MVVAGEQQWHALWDRRLAVIKIRPDKTDPYLAGSHSFSRCRALLQSFVLIMLACPACSSCCGVPNGVAVVVAAAAAATTPSCRGMIKPAMSQRQGSTVRFIQLHVLAFKYYCLSLRVYYGQ